MGILEITIYVIITLLCLAFVIRTLSDIWKIIYKSAPFIVPLLILALLLYVNGNIVPHQKAQKDGNHIEAIKD